MTGVQSPPVQIRPVAPGDARAVAGLLGTLGYPSAESDVETRLRVIRSRPDFAGWVAEVSGQVTGLIGACVAPYFERNGVYGRIVVLVVASEVQGAGVGRRLIAKAEEWLTAQGAAQVFVNSGSHRTQAHAFYERAGYAVTGVRFTKELRPTI